MDPTQWKDTDGDGYGDNQSENATNPDRFPQRKAAANDTDDDGYADNWTSLYNGSNAEGIQLDACPSEWGNSTRRSLSAYAYGCPDSDGDGYTDTYVYDIDPETARIDELGDAFPYERHNQEIVMAMDLAIIQPASRATSVPMKQAFKNGTNGLRWVVESLTWSDTDGDGVINELDTLCPNTPAGEAVNEEGCSQSELDDDEDGVMNNVDLCPGTPVATSVDGDGCSRTATHI